MKRQGNEYGSYDKPRHFDRKGPPRGDRPDRGSDRGYDRGGDRGGYEPRGFDGPRFGERRGGFESRSDDRPQRSNYRASEGRQGGYGRPQRFDNDRPFGRGSSRPPQGGGFDRKERSFGAPEGRPSRLVSASKLKDGIVEANRALAGLIEQFGSTLEGDYDIGTLEVTVSFSDEGKFLGFGRGGAASMTLSLSPLDAEEIIETAGAAEGEAEDFDDSSATEGLDNEDMLEAAAELIDMDDDMPREGGKEQSEGVKA